MEGYVVAKYIAQSYGFVVVGIGVVVAMGTGTGVVVNGAGWVVGIAKEKENNN